MNSTIKPKPCPECGSKFHSAMWHKPRKPIISKVKNGYPQKNPITSNSIELKKRKPLPPPKHRIKQIGKKTLTYNQWRDEVAKPYLDVTYGHVCATSDCVITEALHVDHIQNRGSHPELKMTLDNVQYLCFKHHSAKTDRIPV